MKLDFCVSHNYTQRGLLLPPSSSALPPSIFLHALPPLPLHSLLLLRPPSLLLLLHHHDSVEIPPKTRNKQKQNETHYENITHFIHLTLKNTILEVLHNISENNKLYTMYVIMKIKGADNQGKG